MNEQAEAVSQEESEERRKEKQQFSMAMTSAQARDLLSLVKRKTNRVREAPDSLYHGASLARVRTISLPDLAGVLVLVEFSGDLPALAFRWQDGERQLWPLWAEQISEEDVS